LPDEPIAGVDAVQPGLIGDDEVVLGFRAERGVPRRTTHGIDTAHTDLDGVRRPVVADEINPHCFALVHGNEHAASLPPPLGNPRGVVSYAANREFTEPGRQRIGPAVVGNAERPLERNAKAGAELD
jgi:hypothetical protein